MKFTLPIVVFVSGAVVMIMELAASRIIAPYLGTSVIVWTSLIGVILAALAFGNWIGGRLADRYPSFTMLAGLLLLGAVLIALSSQFQLLLALLAQAADLQTAAVIGVLALFGPATSVLGTIAPLSVKLSISHIEHSGRTVGNLYALSNGGSIIGTFLGGFVLISLIGSSAIIATLSITLGLLSVFVLLTVHRRPTPWMWAGFIALAIALVPRAANSIILAEGETLLADVDTRYGRNWVVEQNVEGYTVRTLRNSIMGYQSGYLVKYPDQLLFSYIKMFDVYEAFKPDARVALMIGGSAYTYPRHFAGKSAAHHATVVEIDPGVTRLAKEYFSLRDDPRMTIVHEDGRTFLNRSRGAYDMIVVDAFNSAHTIPFHLTTKEAVEKMRDNLVQDGVVLVNIIGGLSGRRSSFVAAEYATYKEVFPHVKLYQVDVGGTDAVQNIMLIASRLPLDPSPDSTHAITLALHEWKGEITSIPPLTDDFAPVERYSVL